MPASLRFMGRTPERVQRFLSEFKSFRMYSFIVDGEHVLCDGLPCAAISWQGDTDIPNLHFFEGYEQFQHEFNLVRDFVLQVEFLLDRPVWSEAAHQAKLAREKPSNVLKLHELNVEDFLIDA